MCTNGDLIVVHDDGMLSGENNLVRFFLHSAGIDYDGAGYARPCNAFGGYLMGFKHAASSFAIFPLHHEACVWCIQ
ncbi:hypothetical protein MTO96_046322, partial [Rhipicephalus appendiculatus]